MNAPLSERIARGRELEANLLAKIAEIEPKATEAGGVYQPCPKCNAVLLLDRGVLSEAQAPDGRQIQAAVALNQLRGELKKTRGALARLTAAQQQGIPA